jgi:IMP cyclohydrolase
MGSIPVAELLEGRPYPGRGCVLANTAEDGPVLAYFVTGRSEASRARELVVRDDAAVLVRATGQGSEHDALRHYQAVARAEGWLVVGNGDHVSPVTASLVAGNDMGTALDPHSCEPDAPIFTPRICLASGPSGRPVFGYVRRRPDGGMDRVTWSVADLAEGGAVLLSTYDGTVEGVRPSRCPVETATGSGTAAELLDELWAALSPDLRVGAVAVRPGALGQLLVNR